MIEPFETSDEDNEAMTAYREQLAGRYDARSVYEYLVERARIFETGLRSDQELGLKLANFGVAETLHVREIGFKNPNLIEFTGVLLGGEDATLVQHISQLSFLMIAVNPLEETEPFRMGFDTLPRTQEESK